MPGRFSLIGKGRAGGSIHAALVDLGWECTAVFGRHDDVSEAATSVDVCIIATPDRSIASVAGAIRQGDAEGTSGVVLHLSGALGLDVLAPHRRGALHPLVSLANADVGAAQLRVAWFAVAGDPIATYLAQQLSGNHFVIADEDRARYHATAAIASNHLVALLGQVERLAASLDIPFDVFLPLVQASIDNVAALGPSAALTGPAARGDLETIAKHRAALATGQTRELVAYDALVDLAMRLAKQAPDNEETTER